MPPGPRSVPGKIAYARQLAELIAAATPTGPCTWSGTPTSDACATWTVGYERREKVIDAFFDLADGIITIRSLIVRAWKHYRWDTRPRSPRIR